MRLLCERDDFPELLEATAEHFGIPNVAIVEKDYYVTEALRAIAQACGERTIFKGGTSLSKGWKIIARFSEDIDLYVDKEDRGKKATNTLFKTVESVIEALPIFDKSEKIGSIDGVARSSKFRYNAANRLDGMDHAVLLEAGIQSGTYPVEHRTLTSLLGEFLDVRGIPCDTDDREPFGMNLLHFRRTFVEKMLALHHKVERDLLEAGKPLGSYARHYYDLSQLIERPEVRQMLNSVEYVEILENYQTLTSSYFPRQLLPSRMSLRDSKALFPYAGLAKILERDYKVECGRLCYGEFPHFDTIIRHFESIREFLVALPEPD